MTPSLGEVQVVNATSTKPNPGQPGGTEVVEARRWIERQLEWERTLETLRDHRSERRTQRAA